jgi:hypothetical protein
MRFAHFIYNPRLDWERSNSEDACRKHCRSCDLVDKTTSELADLNSRYIWVPFPNLLSKIERCGLVIAPTASKCRYCSRTS